MSSETQILGQIATDLAFITTGNGYTNSLKKITEGYVPLSSVTEFDQVFFFMGDREPLRHSNDNKPTQWKGELWICIMIHRDMDTLTRAIESWIEDIRKWLYQGTGITANRWYTLDTSLPEIVPYGGKDILKIGPSTIWAEYKSEITFKLNIIYST